MGVGKEGVGTVSHLLDVESKIMNDEDFETWVDSLSLSRVFYCLLILIATILLTWLIPKFLQWLFRDVFGIQYHVKGVDIKKRVYGFRNVETHEEGSFRDVPVSVSKGTERSRSVDSTMRAVDAVLPLPASMHAVTLQPGHSLAFTEDRRRRRGPSDRRDYDPEDFGPSNGTSAVDDDDRELSAIRKSNWFRENFFLLMYAFLQIFIVITGLILAFWCVRSDFFAIVASLGIASFIAFFHLADYFRNFFAYLWIVGANKINRGDLIELPTLRVIGCVSQLNLMHVSLECVDKRHSEDPSAGKKRVLKIHDSLGVTKIRYRKRRYITHIPNAHLLNYPIRIYVIE